MIAHNSMARKKGGIGRARGIPELRVLKGYDNYNPQRQRIREEELAQREDSGDVQSIHFIRVVIS